MSAITTRRAALAGTLATGGGLLLAGCDSNSGLIRSAEHLNRAAQGLFAGDSLVREYSLAERSPIFRENGNTMPESPDYARHLADNFASWRLVIDGLVNRPLALPVRTRRDAVTHPDHAP